MYYVKKCLVDLQVFISFSKQSFLLRAATLLYFQKQGTLCIGLHFTIVFALNVFFLDLQKKTV